MAELFGLVGFDYYLLDFKHGLMDAAQVLDVIRACERVNMTPMVRIGSKDAKGDCTIGHRSRFQGPFA